MAKPSKPRYPMTRGTSQVPIACQLNAEYWLTEAGHAEHLTLDTFRQRLMLGKSEVSDEIIVALMSQIEAETHIPWRDTHLRNALLNVGAAQAHSSLLLWLDGLTWDRTARLDRFFIDVCGADDDEYSRACARVLFLSAVARAYRPGCKADVMVVLCGAQGIGKSKSVLALVPDEAWFTDDLGGDLHERRIAEALQGKWLVEFGEFARINRSTIDMTKSFLTRLTDRYRPAYGRVAKDFPRQCIFVGTTNNRHPLQDVENRRFMPLWCPHYFIDVTPKYRDQLWAEAVARYQKKERWWLTDAALIALAKERQEDARQADAWEDILSDKLAHQSETSMSEVSALLGIKMDRLDKPTQTRIGIAMQAIGWERKRVRQGARLVYVYARIP
jgi:putative DNA primase/helicase